MQKTALIVGAGDATGGAIARRFAREGYTACVTRRSLDKLQPLLEQIRAAGGKAEGFASDARQEPEVIALIEQIESTVGPIEVLVFNIGANVPCSILDETARKYFKIWEMACFGGFLNGREVAKRMVARGRGTIIFTGATASLRGAANFAAFAGAKHALRALAQSMARELGPQNIHVAHVVVDGAIDTEFIRTSFPDRYALKAQDGILDPDHIADTYWMLHAQPRDAWTHELDLRPWSGKFKSSDDAKTVDFYFDFGSPAAYLAATQLPKIAAEAGATLVWKPMLLGGVFQATGNQSPTAVPAKGRYMQRDLALHAQRYGVPFQHNPHFPINTLTLMRGATAVQMQQPERFPAFVQAIYDAIWVDAKNMNDPASGRQPVSPGRRASIRPAAAGAGDRRPAGQGAAQGR